jgi:hypothetical protein
MERLNRRLLEWPNESIPAARHGLDEPRILGRIAQRVAQLLDGAVQPGIEIDERIGRPESPSHLVARDGFAGAFDQQQQNLQGLLGELDPQTLLAELTRDTVELEDTEPRNVSCGWTHKKLRAATV